MRYRVLSDRSGVNPDKELLKVVKKKTLELCEEIDNGTRFTCVDDTVDHWLNNSSYSGKRKRDLFKLASEMKNRDHTYSNSLCKSFLKEEAYPDFKPPRTINARSDEAKVITGPAIKFISDLFFKHDFAVKKIPYSQRGEHIAKVLDLGFNTRYVVTDYSSFEGSFSPEFSKACFGTMIKYFIQSEVADFIIRCDSGGTWTECIHGKAYVNGTRMSGDMWTSLANSVSNLVLFRVASEVSGVKCAGVVEGDDSLFAVSDLEIFYDKGVDVFRRLGFIIEIDEVPSPTTGNFCSTCYVGKDHIPIMDPTEMLMRFGWSFSYKVPSEKLANELLRAKAMSMMCESYGCPILNVLAFRLLQLTEGYNARMRDNWYSKSLLSKEHVIFSVKNNWIYLNGNFYDRYTVPDNSVREEFSKQYGIPVLTQLAVERRIQEWNGGALHLPELYNHFSANHKLTWEMYVTSS